jgi:murein DD-endopeptidase MepM/ murein hydrolase activator NlpD
MFEEKTGVVFIRRVGRRKYVAISAAILAVLFFVLFVWLSSPVSASPVRLTTYFTPAQDIEDAKKDKKETEDAIDEAENKIEKLADEVEALTGELAVLNGLSEEQMTQYLELTEDLAAALIAKKAAIVVYLDSQETLKIKTAEYSARISVMFEFQNKSTLEIMLESDNLAGFFTNLEIIELIGDSDKQTMEEMQATLDDAQLKSEYALQEAIDMQEVADAKEAELKELEALIGTTQDTLDEKQAELSEWEEKEKELEQASAELDDEIQDLQNKLYAGNTSKNTTPPPQGTMTWPYPGDYRIYSAYGMRYHPVYKVNKMHWGVDLGGSYGNPIVAAADGTVLKVDTPVSGQNTGGKNYGNYVVIDHGGGVSTLYAHCKTVSVSVGDSVVAGQTIAACGSTGTSTGPHVHFEVRVNGSKVNPADYIT